MPRYGVPAASFIGALTLCLGTLGLFVAPAAAKTVVTRTTVSGVTTLAVTGDPGEQHDVMVEFDEDENLYFITDDSATLDPGTGCNYRSADEMIVCPPGKPQVSMVVVTTGEGDDSVLIDLEAGEHSVISTGSGDDFVKGTESRDMIDAGPGSDAIDASDGDDVVLGGSGDDVIDAGFDNDYLDGGAGDDLLNGEQGSDYIGGSSGSDTADYSAYKSGVVVDIDGNADDGLPGEHDNVATDVENVHGGSGPDVLVGSGARNVLSGAGGDDWIDSRDGAPDVAACGTGRDYAAIDTSDSTDAHCEVIDRSSSASVPSGYKITIKACRRGKKVKSKACVEVSCPGARGACKGTIALEATVRSVRKSKRRRKSASMKLGSARFTATSVRATKVNVRLAKRARRLLARKGRLKAMVKVDVRDSANRREGDAASLKLRGKKKNKKRSSRRSSHS